MPAGSLLLTDNALTYLLETSVQSAAITAVLLAPTYAPNLAQHRRFADLMASEVHHQSKSRLAMTGLSVTDKAFRSDDLVFGDPITIGPARYVAFLFGLPRALNVDSRILGIADLSPDGGVLEAQNARFSIACPDEGWFQLDRA